MGCTISLADEIELRKSEYSPWMYMFTPIKGFKAKHGHCDVPRRENKPLYHWSVQQRSLDGRNKLSQKRFNLLNSIHFRGLTHLHEDKSPGVPKDNQLAPGPVNLLNNIDGLNKDNGHRLSTTIVEDLEKNVKCTISRDDPTSLPKDNSPRKNTVPFAQKHRAVELSSHLLPATGVDHLVASRKRKASSHEGNRYQLDDDLNGEIFQVEEVQPQTVGSIGLSDSSISSDEKLPSAQNTQVCCGFPASAQKNLKIAHDQSSPVQFEAWVATVKEKRIENSEDDSPRKRTVPFAQKHHAVELSSRLPPATGTGVDRVASRKRKASSEEGNRYQLDELNGEVCQTEEVQPQTVDCDDLCDSSISSDEKLPSSQNTQGCYGFITESAQKNLKIAHDRSSLVEFGAWVATVKEERI